MENLSFESAPPPPPEPKKKTGLVVGIGAAVVLCLCFAVIAAAVGYVLLNPGLLLQVNGTKFTNQDGNWSIYYPKGWVYEEYEYSGGATFASSSDVLDNGPEEGAGFYVDAVGDISDLEEENISTPEELLQFFLDNEFYYDIDVIKDIASKRIGGYDGATVTITMYDDDAEITYYIELAAVMTPNTYYLMMLASNEDQWSQFSSSLESMLATFKILIP